MTTPADNFWVLLNKNQFNHLVESGKDSLKPMLLRDVKGLKFAFFTLKFIFSFRRKDIQQPFLLL